MFELLAIILKKWKLILGITILVSVITAAASFLLPNYYDSTVIFQPSNPGSFDRNAVFPVEGSDARISMFGSSKDADRVLTIGSSHQLYSYLIDKYKLYQHYDIEPTEQYANYKVVEKLKKNYKMQKNALGSLEIVVSDKDPQFAATMANDIYTQIDSINRQVILSKKYGIVDILENQNKELKERTRLLKDSMQNVIARNPKDTITSNYIGALLTESLAEYTSVAKNLEQNKAILSLNQSTLHLFEEAIVADRKTSPKRSLIVIGAALFTFFMMIIAALFSQKFTEYQEEENNF